MPAFAGMTNQGVGGASPGVAGAAIEHPLEGVAKDLPWALSLRSRETTGQG